MCVCVCVCVVCEREREREREGWRERERERERDGEREQKEALLHRQGIACPVLYTHICNPPLARPFSLPFFHMRKLRKEEGRGRETCCTLPSFKAQPISHWVWSTLSQAIISTATVRYAPHCNESSYNQEPHLHWICSAMCHIWRCHQYTIIIIIIHIHNITCTFIQSNACIVCVYVCMYVCMYVWMDGWMDDYVCCMHAHSQQIHSGCHKEWYSHLTLAKESGQMSIDMLLCYIPP